MGTGNAAALALAFSVTSVQPRGYGERLLIAGKNNELAGSAPWVRGTHEIIVTVLESIRFSPVGTGNAQPKRAAIIWPPVQPRGYGERI